MKKSIIIVFSFLIFSCTPQECPVLSYDELNRLAYDSDNSPYTGRCSVYLNDKISSIQQYLNGKDYGRWTFYYPNGKIETKAKFNQFGQRVGKWKYYYQNGKLKQTSVYYNGERSGIWTTYDSIGNLIDEINYSSKMKPEQ